MCKADAPQAFIEPNAFRRLPNDSQWTVETLAYVSKPSSTGRGEPKVGSYVRYLYANLTPNDLVGLLQVIHENPEEQTVAVYRQDGVRNADWVEQWIATAD